MIEDEFNDYEYNSQKNIVQTIITVCVHGSCYGPLVNIFPTKILFECRLGEDNPVVKSVNLVNNSKSPGHYQVQYDSVNSLLKCNPSFGVIERRVQIKLELKHCPIGYYYKRLYVLITNHHPVYVDVYAISSSAATVNPLSCFQMPFELPVFVNNFADFFKDVIHPMRPHSSVKHLVDVFPRELHFGYVRHVEIMSFQVHNNTESPLFVSWIYRDHGRDRPFTMDPKRVWVGAGSTKTLQCIFRPKTVSNVYFAEFESTFHFGPDRSASIDENNDEIPNTYVATPMNISIIAMGHSFKEPFNGWTPKCKLSSRVIIMPPSVPASEPVYATFLIKKVVQVPTTFQFRPPDKSIFLVKPKCGLINGDYQIVVFQLTKTTTKESLYAERWSIVFDDFDNNSVNIDIYASVEFGCVVIGEKNCIHIPNSVQVGCEIDTQVPIINMTRHRLHYYIYMYDQQPKSDIKSSSTSLSSIRFHYERLEETEDDSKETEENSEETDYGNTSEFDHNNAISGVELNNSKSSITLNTYSTITTIESTQSLINVLKNRNSSTKISNPEHSSFVFKFDKLTGELGPNEKSYLKLTFCPLKRVLYTVNVKCYIMCNNFQEIINILPVVLKGSGCKTQLEITPANCNINNVIVNTEKTQRFIIENKSHSYANIKFLITPMYSTIFWAIPSCKISLETFKFTPQKSQCKIDLSIYPTELGIQKLFINVKFDNNIKSPSSEIENIITISMNVTTSILQISRITNDSIPYFGKLTLNKLFHSIKINNELRKAYKNISPIIWTIPVISESTIYEFQFNNSSKVPISWAFKYNKCMQCTSKNNINNKNNSKRTYGTLANKCVHYGTIQICPTANLEMENFSNIQIKLNNIVNTEEVKLNYKWSNVICKTLSYDTELLLESKTFNGNLISFDTKYGTNGHLEFNFIPIFIAHPNPPAQAFWMYNNNNYQVKYSIIDDDALSPAYPYFCCLNSCGIINAKSIHPILFVFAPNQLCKFEATVFFLSNNIKNQINLYGLGESYIRTNIFLGPGLSSFLPVKNNRQIFLSTESIILKPMFTYSNAKSVFCLINNSNEDIMFEWKECMVEKILNATVTPIKGYLNRNRSQLFEITVNSYKQPAILTIMFNVTYKLVSQTENYYQSLKNYAINKEKLNGVFIIKECGNYKPKLNMKIEDEPQEKNLVLYVYVRINDKFNNKWIDKEKHNIKKHNPQQQKQISKSKVQYSVNFQNVLCLLWLPVRELVNWTLDQWKTVLYSNETKVCLFSNDKRRKVNRRQSERKTELVCVSWTGGARGQGSIHHRDLRGACGTIYGVRSYDPTPTTLQDLQDAVLVQWMSIPQERIVRFITSMKDRMEAVIKARGSSTKF
ncbi:Immunoglobulin-like fold [Cinara cedri]|uniref:Immunoglobulin-like fold n=1 Tax=Cinara cedri TaxID=506608 RepID=A0A5E4N0Z5_9HEMI|nr:Immunoglobulin-like fold [Cinara cedri]